jgi:hypothetical protein
MVQQVLRLRSTFSENRIREAMEAARLDVTTTTTDEDIE